ncbi:MAG: aldehyde dehydrogenase family protein, partial [Candidatus Heimdallarchaeota archaeon]
GSGFGGYKESGYGREGGKEGLFEYVKYNEKSNKFKDKFGKVTSLESNQDRNEDSSLPMINRTPKLYIGGKQVRPDATYVISIKNPNGRIVGEVGRGNRKDVRNAIDIARKSLSGWSSKSGHNRAQVLYFIAENLDIRRNEFINRLINVVGYSQTQAELEFDTSIEVIFSYASWADKYDGLVHSTLSKHVTLAMNEPMGNMAIICPDEHPLLSFISAIMPSIAMGNVVTVMPSEKYPILATDFYQILETSDLSGGVVNIITGYYDELTVFLASHQDIDSIWFFGSKEGSHQVELESCSNMKRTWVSNGKKINWFDQSRQKQFLRECTQVKNIWIPYG